MKRFFENYRGNLVILAVSASMTLSAAFVITFTPSVALHVDNSLVGTLFFSAAVLLLGIGGVMLYLVKGMVRSVDGRRLSGLLSICPLLLVLGITVVSGSGEGLAFLIPAIAFSVMSLWNDEPHRRETENSLLPVFAASVSLFFGLAAFMPLPWGLASFPYGYVLAFPALAAGVAGLVAWLSPHAPERAKKASRIAVGLLLALVAVIAAAVAERYVLAIFYTPLALVTLIFPFLKGFRLGAPLMEDMSEENLVLFRFLNITEIVAWSVFVFSSVYLYVNPRFQEPALFLLFAAAFTLFVYEYRVRPIRKVSNFKNYARTSIANAVMLSIVSHFTGGIESPYNVFFVFILLSGIVLPDPRAVLLRLGYIIAYFGFEFSFVVITNAPLPAETLLIDLVLIVVTGFYAHQLTKRRREVDRDVQASSDELRKVIERERDTRHIISEQAAELAEARTELDAVLESVADGIVAVDTDGRVKFINDAAKALLLIENDEALGRRAEDVFRVHDRDGVLDITPMLEDVTGAVSTRGSGSGSVVSGRNILTLSQDARLEQDDSGDRFIEGAIIGLPAEGRRAGAVITFRDVTYRREVDRLKTDFISVAAHQLRTPLSSIRWYLELLNDPEEGKLNKNQKMFARNAYISTRRMLSLVNGLLAVTRVESGRIPVRPEPVNLGSLTEDVLEELKAGMQKKDVNAHLRVDGRIPEISLDPDLSHEVFINLLNNAIRYSPEGGEVLVRIEGREDDVLWSVADNGIGIPEGERNKIFDKFYRAANAVNAESEGTGLGLYLAKFIVDQWGGRIWFESEEGEGTTFYVTVPYEGMRSQEGEISLHA